MRITFYDAPPAARLPRIVSLVEAAWERGRRMVIHCADPATADELDRLLWTFHEESFVPHEVVPPGGSPQDPEARIVLVTQEVNPIGAEVLIQDAPTSPDFARGFPFVIDIVDHRTPELLAASRARYKAWRDEGLSPDYRKQ